MKEERFDPNEVGPTSEVVDIRDRAFQRLIDEAREEFGDNEEFRESEAERGIARRALLL